MQTDHIQSFNRQALSRRHGMSAPTDWAALTPLTANSGECSPLAPALPSQAVNILCTHLHLNSTEQDLNLGNCLCLYS